MTNQEQQPMSEARIIELKRQHKDAIDVLWNATDDDVNGVLQASYDDAWTFEKEMTAEVERLRREVAACEREITREGQKIADARDDVMRAEQALALVEHRSAKREAALTEIVRAVAEASRRYTAPGDMVGLPPHMRNQWATLVVPSSLQEQARAVLACDSAWVGFASSDRQVLLDEVERLQAHVAALEEVVRAVVDGGMAAALKPDMTCVTYRLTLYSDIDLQAKARALLASADEAK